jgi:hypothetical protein
MPSYYDGAGGMQPFDVIDAFGLDFYEGNVVKYLVRWRKKGGVADLRKARTYLDEIIKRAEAQGMVPAQIPGPAPDGLVAQAPELPATGPGQSEAFAILRLSTRRGRGRRARRTGSRRCAGIRAGRG